MTAECSRLLDKHEELPTSSARTLQQQSLNDSFTQADGGARIAMARSVVELI
jgi:hypothetical protein